MTECDPKLEYVADPQCPYFVHTLTDKPTLAIVGQRLQAVLDHPEGGPLIPAIWDMRNADLSEITLSADINYSENRPASGTARVNAKSCAVVANQRDYGIIRQFFSMIDVEPNNANIVFEMSEAVAWLKSET